MRSSQSRTVLDKAVSHKKRRISRSFISVMALTVLVAIFMVLVRFVPILTVNKVEVQGASVASPEYIVSISGVEQGDNLVTVDKKKVARNVIQDPWVQKAKVKKSWPSTLVIEVTEHELAGFVNTSEGPVLVDSQGIPFLQAEPLEGFIEFTGMDETDTSTLSAATTVLYDIPQDIRVLVVRVDAPTADSVKIILNDNREFYFGSTERLPEKIVAMQTALGMDGTSWNLSNPMQISKR